jgi:hypothetical protein
MSSSVSAYPSNDYALSVQHVRFGFRCVDWNVVLTTDAPLDLLVRLEDFRLPGEKTEQAERRRYLYNY